MALSNHLHSMETKIGRYMGELIDKRDEIGRIEQLLVSLPSLRERCEKLEALIDATELIIREDYPDWQRDTIHPTRPQVHHSPIKIGECGRKALEVLRDADDWMTSRDVAKAVLRLENIADVNRATVDRVANSVAAAFKKRCGDVLESDGNWPQSWRVIRGNASTAKKQSHKMLTD